MSSISSKRIKIRFSSRQTSSFSLSAETIGSNEDLLTEILVRLPIKSLLKFKCVSKHWLSLISNPRFSHRRNSFNNSLCGLFLTGSNSPYAYYQFVSLDPNHSKPPFENLNFVNDPGDIEIIQSCNGLLLCRSFRPASDRTFYVYNPTTKQYTILPQLHRVEGVALAFDPSKSPHYKVIYVRKHRFLQHHYHIEIYSSKNGSRRSSGSPFTTENSLFLRRGVFCNGVIHWLNACGGASLCFDVDVGEQLKEMPMPPIPQIDDGVARVMHFGESRGSLHLIDIYGPHTDQANKQLDVYEMKADCSGWFKKYSIDLDAIAGAFPEMIRNPSSDFWGLNDYAFEILAFDREESDHEGSIFSVLLHIPNKVIRYDFKDKSSTKLCDFYSLVEGEDHGPEDAWNLGISVVSQYIESLACV